MDDLIQFLVVAGFALLTALWNWFRKRGEFPGEEPWTNDHPQVPPPRPRTPRPEPRPRRIDWEEELRRVLEGEEAETRPPARETVEPAPVPPPLPPRPAPAPAPQLPPRVFQAEPPEAEAQRGLPVSLPTLVQAAQARQQAGQVGQDVMERLRAAAQHLKAHTETRGGRTLAPEIQRARDLLKNREMLRAGIIAAVVLGPAKAMEPDQRVP